MEEAHDFQELKELVTRLGLRDNRRDHPRYKVDISGTYSIEQERQSELLNHCRLVDVSRKGLAIKTKHFKFNEGTILHLQFSQGIKEVNVVGRAVHIVQEDDGYLIGVEPLSENTDIANQLFSQ